MTGDGSIKLPVELDDKQAEKELNALERKIRSTEDKINKSTTERNAIAEKLRDAQRAAVEAYTEVERLEKRLAASKEKTSVNYKGSINPAEFAAELENQAQISAELERQRAVLEEKEAAALKLEAQDAKAVGNIAAQTAELERQEGEYERINLQLTRQGTQAWPQVKEAAAKASQNITASLKGGLKTVLKYGIGIRSLFVLFRRLRTAIIDGVKTFAQYDTATQSNINNLKAALSGLKASWGAAFAPIFNAVAPALQTLIGWLSSAASAVSAFFAVLGGKTSYKKAVANLGGTAGAAADAAGSLGDASDAAKELKRQLSGLDEMNRWESSDTGSSGGGSGGGGSGGGGDGISFVDEAVDMDSPLANIAEYIRQNLESVLLLVEEFAFVIGLILVATGANIPLGLGMMVAAGIAGYQNIKENWGAIKEQLQGSMGAIYTIVGGALLVIGAILAFSSVNIPLGIALMAGGAAALATVTAANWGALKENISGTTQSILTIVSGALIVLGAVLACSGVNLPLGIALLAAGAATLATVTVLNWGGLQEKLQGPIGTITAIASGALLALGLILALSGVAFPLGIGLIAAGAAGLAATAEAKWGLVGKVQEALNEVSNAWDTWSQEHPVISTVLKYLLGLITTSGGNALVASVKLTQDEWTTVADWVKTKLGPAVSKAIGLAQDAWTTVSDWVKTKLGGAVSKAVGLAQSGWSTVKAWVENSYLGGVVNQAVGLAQDGWTRVKYWVETFTNWTFWQPVGLTRGGLWTHVKYWVETFSNWTFWQPVGLTRGGLWTYVSSWVYSFWTGTVWQSVGLTRGGLWTYVSEWVKSFWTGTVWQSVGLTRGGLWTYVSEWVKSFWTGTVWQSVGLTRGGLWSSVVNWIYNNSLVGGVVEVGVSLYKWGWSTIKSWLGLANGGIVTERGFHLFAGGGFINASATKDWGIPAYANGTALNHGTLFAAGEAGPEIVGHIGGRTEVLNKSQLAQTMYAAVVSGMSRAVCGLETTLSALNSKIPPLTADMMPAVARGTVVPPRMMGGGSGAEEIKAAIDRLAASLSGSGGGNTYNVTAKANGRSIFDLVLQEGRQRQAITGQNPFFLEMGGA